MRYRPLGRWGLQVSAVGLGSWLTYGGSVAEQTATECIQRAYEAGITFFDTANVYAAGRAEEVMGRALAAFPRERYVLASKVYFPMSESPNDRGLSRKHIVEQSRASLRRLGVDYIDLYQCHRFDPGTPLEETCRAFDDLVRDGTILYWGTSEWSADQIAHASDLCRARGWAEPVSNQPQYSALWRVPEERVLPVCAERGLGNVVWSPLAMGVLTGKYTRVDDVPAGTRAAGTGARFMQRFLTQDVLDAVASLRPVAEQAGCSLAQLSLAWCLSRPSVASVIVGATSPHHVDDNVGAGDLDLDADVLAAVDDTLRPVAVT